LDRLLATEEELFSGGLHWNGGDASGSCTGETPFRRGTGPLPLPPGAAFFSPNHSTSITLALGESPLRPLPASLHLGGGLHGGAAGDDEYSADLLLHHAGDLRRQLLQQQQQLAAGKQPTPLPFQTHQQHQPHPQQQPLAQQPPSRQAAQQTHQADETGFTGPAAPSPLQLDRALTDPVLWRRLGMVCFCVFFCRVYI
jgi:hypothetical protein